MKFLDFASLIVFYAVQHWYGLKPALAVSVAVATAVGLAHLARRERPGALFLFSTGLTVSFGLIDLLSANPVFFRYEAAVTNLATGFFFGATLFRGTPMIQELYQSRPGTREMTPSRVAFFRMLTRVWTAYFFVKCAAYAWVASRYSLEEALAIRAVAGSVSLYGLLFLSVFGGRFVYRAFYIPR